MKRRFSRIVSLTLGSVLALGVTMSARADVGPAPSCPSGTHSAYLYGRRCVKDGYHLVAGPDGNVTEVPDEKPVAAPIATPNETPGKAPQEAPRQPGKTGGCSVSDGDIPMLGTTLLAAGLLGLALALRRRREHP